MQGQGTVGNIQANTVVVFGTNQGVFVYSGTPALGNPPIASMSSGTLDPYGNTVKPQLEVKSPTSTSFIQLLATTLAIMNLGTGDASEATPGQMTSKIIGSGLTRYLLTDVTAPRVSGEASNAIAEMQLFSPQVNLALPPGINLVTNDGAGNQAFIQIRPDIGVKILNGIFTSLGDVFIGSLASNVLFRLTQSQTGEGDIFSPKQTAGDTPAQIALLSALQTAAFPLIHLIGSNLTVDGATTLSSTLGVTGIVTATGGTPASPTVVTTDSWTTPTLGAAFNAGPKFKMNADKTVSLTGETVTNANTAANTAMFTLPATHRPLTDKAFLAPNNFSGYTAPARLITVIAATGVVQVDPAGTSGNFLLLDGIRFPIDI